MINSQSVNEEMPNQILPQNSVHSMPQSSVMTQNDQQKSKHKKPSKIKHKKALCVFLVSLFALMYYLTVKILKPPEIEKQQVKFEQADIQFDTNLGQKTAWIKQNLDHFDPTQKRVWKQRLVVDIDLAKMNKSTPIFLNIPALTSAKQPNSYINIREINNFLKGTFICLQPRYFGESLPFGDQSFLHQNLKYLTIEQIIEDVAYVIDRIITFNYFKITKANPWIITGDSYSGMIVVWLRAKYPELTIGAYVSSPTIPTAMVPQISQRLYSNMISGGKMCKSMFFRIINDFFQKAYGPKSEGLLLDIGRGLQISAQEAMQLIMDKIRTISRQLFISYCTAGPDDDQKIVSLLVDWSYYTDVAGVDPIAYSKTQLKSQESWEEYEAVRRRRAFQWLRCSQIGLFQVTAPADKKSLNFRNLNESYFRNRCKDLFGVEIWPNTQSLIDKFSQYMKTLKNLIVANGFYDIWLPYSYSPKNSSSSLSISMKCSFCEHNFDIKGNQILSTQANQLHMKQKQIIQGWISQKPKK